jgi:hypothetical protein
VLGGPIVKDRTFFFFSYEGLRAVQPTFSIVDVPSLAARASAAPNAKALIDAFPLPNGPATGVDLSQLAASVSNRGSVDATSMRIDQSLKSNLTLFGRYDHSPSNLTLSGCGYTLTTDCKKQIGIDTGTIGLTAILKPTITNDLRVNYSREQAVTSFGLQQFGGAILPPTSALFPSFVTPSTGFAPVLILTGRGLGITNGEYTDHVNPQVNVVDALSVVRGAHQMKFGFDFRQLTPKGSPVLEPLSECPTQAIP